MKLKTTLSMLAAAGLAGTAFANDPTTASAAGEHDKAKLVSKLADKDIHSADRTQIGEVEDFVVDESGRITHAVVSYGGTLGVGGRQTLVPWELMSSNIQDGRIVFERAELESAPQVTDEELLADDGWRAEVDQYWDATADTGTRTAEADTEPEPAMGSHPATGSESEPQSEEDTERSPY